MFSFSLSGFVFIGNSGKSLVKHDDRFYHCIGSSVQFELSVFFLSWLLLVFRSMGNVFVSSVANRFPRAVVSRCTHYNSDYQYLFVIVYWAS